MLARGESKRITVKEARESQKKRQECCPVVTHVRVAVGLQQLDALVERQAQRLVLQRLERVLGADEGQLLGVRRLQALEHVHEQLLDHVQNLRRPGGDIRQCKDTHARVFLSASLFAVQVYRYLQGGAGGST